MARRLIPRVDIAEAEAIGAVLAAFESACYAREMVAEYGDGDECPEWQTAQALAIRFEAAYRALDPFDADTQLRFIERRIAGRVGGA